MLWDMYDPKTPPKTHLEATVAALRGFEAARVAILNMVEDGKRGRINGTVITGACVSGS